MSYDVFISYSSKDKAVANATCAVLESRNIRCWIAPRDVQPGRPYGEAILDGILGCRIMVLVFSSNANTSGHIPKEVERAVSRGVTIIPVRIEDVAPAKSLDYFIGSVHWLDAMTPPLEKHLVNLAETIHTILLQSRAAGVDASPSGGAGMMAAAPPSDSVPTAKPLVLPTGKRAMPPAVIYGGAGAALALAVVLGWVLLRPTATPQAALPAATTPQSSSAAPADTAQFATPPEAPPPTPLGTSAAVTPPATPIPSSASPSASNFGGGVGFGVASGQPASSAAAESAENFKNQGLYARDKGGDSGKAIEDFDQAIRLRPDFPEAYADRGDAYLWKGDFGRAANDYDEVLRLDPEFAGAFHRRGVIRLLSGQFVPAQQDLKLAIESNQPNPDKAFDPIWLALAQAKGGQNSAMSDLKKYAGSMNLTSWPGPVARLFLGTATPQDVLLAARASDAGTSARQQCQAYYFIGEFLLLRGQRANAAQLFQQSVATRESRQFAYLGAKVELGQP